MVVCLSLLLVATLVAVTQSACDQFSVPNGVVDYSAGVNPGNSASVTCLEGYAIYNPRVTCQDDGSWRPANAACHQVAVQFSDSSIIKYAYPIARDSIDSTIKLSFAMPANKTTGMLLRLDSKKHANGQRDHITVEIVGGFMAVTMQLSSSSQSIVAFCQDNTAVNDEKLHKLHLTRTSTSLQMSIDGRNIQCIYPSSYLKFKSLKSISVGHLRPSWGPEYGFMGCMTHVTVDGIAPLVLADLKDNSGRPNVPITSSNVQYVDQCTQDEEEYSTIKAPTEPPKPDPVDPVQPSEAPTGPIIGPITEKAVSPDENENDDKTTIIIIIVTVAILIVLILLIGIVCKRYYKNKGTYRLDETKVSSAPVEPEREYFI